MNEKISVIVPVYNAEKFLERCTNSILNQTYSNIELILVNDGSKDNSLELCKKIAEKDSRVVVVDKPNGGAASARNKGLDVATGEYIGFCDADDSLDLDMYETLKRILDENNLEVIDLTSKEFDAKGNLTREDANTGALEIISSEDYIKSIFKRTGNVHLGTKLFKADVIKDLRIPEGRRVEDFYFTICFLLNVERIGRINLPFYNYYAGENSVTRSATGSIYLDALYFYDLALKLLDNKNISMEEEKTYYLLKMYYLLSISITGEERKKYSSELKLCKKSLRTHFKDIGKNRQLAKKEKIMLYISCISMRLSRLFFCIKNGGKK